MAINTLAAATLLYTWIRHKEVAHGEFRRIK